MTTEPITIWRAKLQDGRMVLQPRKDDARAKIQHALGVALQGVGDGTLVSADCPLTHSYIDGVYVRTIFIPAGTRIIGKIHKHAHANILSQGRARVFTPDGGVEMLEGPRVMVSPAGCQRIVDAETDLVWTTIHATPETDLEAIEDHVIAKDYSQFYEHAVEMRNMKTIGGMQ